ncbi:Patatin/Phospholipase A2-related protein [Corchorus olitorius]|uniref:Patatin n=1 Tax=Corchorus olitorius TaxID=93759 RepID=A0A1R3JMW0_9ROSI|nr:Patatin/Phospholipase A2-related protein [Corchorus olitorius]
MDGPEARIADYFDFIAGTSTGGLVTAMLTSPDPQDPKNRPFTAQNIIKFYHHESPMIFPPQRSKRSTSRVDMAARELCQAIEDEEGDDEEEERMDVRPRSLLSWVEKVIQLVKYIIHAKYEDKELKQVIKAMVGDRKLRQTLTNVIIPSFDVKLLQPKVFSTLKASRDDLEDAPLLDVCLSTSAAPLYLPLHIFEIKSANGSSREFNMTDGGVAANNPTLLAISEVSKEMGLDIGKADDKSKDCSKLLVLSLGTGSTKRYTHMNVTYSDWGPFEWLLQGLGDGSIPIVDVLMTANDAIADMYLSGLFQATSFKDNYLRIQTDTLTITEAAMDNSSTDHLENLEKIGNELLTKPVSTVNLATGLLEATHNGAVTNEAALKKFAKRLVDERRHRRQAQRST